MGINILGFDSSNIIVVFSVLGEESVHHLLSNKPEESKIPHLLLFDLVI